MAIANNEFEITKTEEEWRRILTPEQFQVLRKHGTERPHTSPLDKQYGKGTFVCAGCDLPLFTYDTKFDSRTGWPSFWDAVPRSVLTNTDNTLGITRIEAVCRRCGGHLGHVFDDGPADRGGLRYCINSASLRFIHRDNMKAEGYGDLIDQVEDIQ